MDVLRFTFESPWNFIGVVILLGVVGGILRDVVKVMGMRR